MKKSNKITTGLFLFLAVILFLFALSMIFDRSLDLKFYPWDKEKFRYHFSLDDNKKIEEKVIPMAVFLNREDGDVYSWIGDYFNSHADYLKAVEYYQKAIKANFLVNHEIYQNLLKIYEKLNKEEDKELLLSFLSQKITKPEEFPLPLNKFLAKNAYLIGENYLKNEEKEKTIYWWSEAVRVLSEWSYFHVELASLYQQLGEGEKAQQILKNCLNYFYPKEHCQLYQNNLRDLEEPGFWREEILKIE